MAKHHHFWQQDYAHHVGGTIQIITCFLSFVFLTVGTPLGVLMLRQKTPQNKTSCYTLWGRRDDCGSPDYDWRMEWDTCADRRTRFQAGEAFSIVGIFSLLLQLLFACYQVGGSNFKYIIIGIALLSVTATVVPFAVVAAVYNSTFCGLDNMTSKYTKYGPGFALIVVSFCIQCIGLILFIFLEK